MKLFFCALLALLRLSCAGRTTPPATDQEDITDLLNQAQSVFAQAPKSQESVGEAWRLISEVNAHIADEDPHRYEALCEGAKYATWLAYHGEQKTEISRFALEAINLCEKAVRVNADRVEAYYYRAIATGLFARENKLQASDAMKRIERDALQAVKIDPTFAHAGPHRLLAALYLRAPGPPAGVGSLRRAQKHIRQALQLAPDYPENVLFEAELQLRLNNPHEARRLVEKVLSSKHAGGDIVDQEDLLQQALELQERIEKQ